MVKNTIKSCLLMALLSVASLAIAAEGSLSKQASGTALGQRYTWYDGDQPRQVWVDPALVAEFAAGGNGSKTVRSLAPQARDVTGKQRGIRLWQVETDPVQTARSLGSSKAVGEFSPVLRDGSSTEARMRALPGNVIVHLRPGIGEGEVQAWMQERQLRVLRKLDFAPNAYLIASEPGLESLELANSLRRHSEVSAAMPNWWVEVQAR